ncbi:hypothetical protein [Pseudonocardia spinosispora]|nr:hypothetical protein [Pseudonocardia spinosispora]
MPVPGSSGVSGFLSTVGFTDGVDCGVSGCFTVGADVPLSVGVVGTGAG